MNYIIKKQNWMATAVVAVLLIGGVVYFVSDPIKAIIDRKVENWTEWTPEKIREYPAEWLMSAQRDLGERQKKLKGRRFSIRKNQFSWEDSFRRSEREVKVLGKYLAVAAERYRDAEKNDAWPVSMRDEDYAESYDRNRLKNEMVAQYKAKDRAERKTETYKKMVSRAESLTERIDAKQDQISEILLDLALAIEMAKAAEQMTDLTGLYDRGKEIQVTVKALMEELDRAFDGHSLPSMNRSLNNDVLFEEIMNKSEAKKTTNNPAVHVVAREAK
jgi:hypothetical protein